MGARIVSLVNQKGGVGKTTTAVSLAVALARRGQRVLLVDLDPQANATSALGVLRSDRPGVYDALLDETPIDECIARVEAEGVDLVPSSAELSGAEVELVPVLARERRLVNALQPVRERYDWVLIDCPPSLGLLTINALTASDSVIIPVQCEYMALEGLSRLMETLELVRRNLNPGLYILGVILTMFDPRTRLAQQVVDEVRGHFPQTFATIIPRSVRLSEAPSHGQSIFRYDPGGRSAAAYEAVASELLERVGVAV
ncbi:MAG: AAA family ATPase [Dehalococcoidia bacterium]|jgi:chromosome partitioning protein|uniref:ParA family protein n=1 Tax=Tepidiforma bonchosmolovskayae TaxID=2601677 RepID=A0ABX6C1K3_9CHLR|nr:MULTISPECIES: AAA family ATPase [Tepidiforma]MCL6644329.1 AAA family ATPase [Dehalococcoidia bacterium]QFG02963.1 ParA family protein [Tepidiforma bonchosmolovskayae]GIW14585.1 MAG: sporulation initiation inhibitor Soj [Tepidiforma sp.]